MKLIKYGIIAGIGWYLWKQYEEGAGADLGWLRIGRNRGTRPGSGPGGNCTCPACGAIAPHTWNVPCYQTICTRCGALMVR